MSNAGAALAPEVLAAAAADPEAAAWRVIWLDSCDQGECRPGSELLLPWLAETVAAFPATAREEPLALGGFIARDAVDRGAYADAIVALRELASAGLASASSDDRFVYLQQALLGYEGDQWAPELDNVIDAEATAACPACGEETVIGIGPEDSLVEPGLHGRLAARLHDEAVTAGRVGVAVRYTCLFGRLSCPECGTTFDVAAALGSEDQAG